MTPQNAPKKKPTGDYAKGYCRPPQSGKFKPGQSGNPAGKVKGQPSIKQVLLEEAARLVKVKVGDTVEHHGKERMMIGGLLDRAARSDVAAARLYFSLRFQIMGPSEPPIEAETPLTAEELEILKMLGKPKKESPDGH
jgi:hypothetical protein